MVDCLQYGPRRYLDWVIFSRRLPHYCYALGTPRYDLRVHESK